MSTYNTQLQTNNTDLQRIFQKLQNKATFEPALQNKTITPSAETQVVTADSEYDGLGQVTVNGDENLVAENIKSGVSIFGVEGNAEVGTGSNVSYNTCTVKYKTEASSGFLRAFYMALENGQPTLKSVQTPSLEEITIENVICDTDFYGSILSIIPGYRTLEGATVVDSFNIYSHVKFIQFHITASANEVVTIDCYDND